MELLITGSFTDTDFETLQNELKERDIEVARYFTKSYETEVVRFLFRDLDAYKLLRDGVLFATLQWAAQKGVKWVKDRKPNAQINIGADLRFEKENQKVSPINIGLPSDEEKAWEELKESVTLQFVESLEGDEIVNIYWDEQEKKLKVSRMKV